MNFLRRYLFLLTAFIVGCNDSSTTESVGDGKVEVSIGGSYAITTKTALGDDLESAKWIEGDQIAVWAEGDSGFALSAECFEMRYYGSSYSTADFWATISPMEEGEYTYYGVYPYPTSYNNTSKTATFTLPAIQNGEYDGANDIMVATPLVAQQALTGSALGATALPFSHMMHILRLEIPDGRNDFGMDLTGLDITFSQDVVGDVTVDYTDPTAATSLSNGSSDISIVFDEPFTTGDGKYIWVFMHPTTLSGEVTIVARGEDGAKSKTKVTTSISGEFAAREITPIKFTTLEPSTVTTLQVKVPHADVKTNIGETLQSVTFTAPTGLLINGESNSLEYEAELDGDDTYELYFYDLTVAELATLNSGSIGVRFDTKSVYKTPSSISISGVAISDVKLVDAVIVPYLVDPNIDKITKSGEGNEDWTNSSSAVVAVDGLTGWYGGQRSQWDTGWIRVRPYATTTWFSASTYESRITTCAISTWGVKSDANVTLRISYDVAWYKNKTTSVSLNTGTTTSTALSGGFVSSKSSSLSSSTSVSVEIESAVSTYMIAWETSSSASSGSTNLGYDTVTITNLVITIVEE